MWLKLTLSLRRPVVVIKGLFWNSTKLNDKYVHTNTPYYWGRQRLYLFTSYNSDTPFFVHIHMFAVYKYFGLSQTYLLIFLWNVFDLIIIYSPWTTSTGLRIHTRFKNLYPSSSMHCLKLLTTIWAYLTQQWDCIAENCYRMSKCILSDYA